MSLRPLLIFAAGLLIAAAALAQDAELKLELRPNRFGVEDRVQLVLTIAGVEATGRPQLGELNNIRVLGPPSTSKQFSWVNGVASNFLSYTWIVQAEHPGPAAVGPITLEIDGQQLRSGSLVVEVAEGTVTAPRARRYDPFATMRNERSRAPAEPVAKMRVIVPNRSIADGEVLLVQFVLDTNVRIEGFEWSEPPSFPGWWSQRLDKQQPIDAETIVVDGQQLSRYPIYEALLIPLGPGALTIPSALARVGTRSAGFFAAPQVVQRATDEIEIEVRPRPATETTFDGAVGDLVYSAELDPAHVEWGEAVQLKITVEGRGNLPLIAAPSIWPDCGDGCDRYEPVEEQSIDIGRRGIRGERSWTVSFVPRQPGILTLPAIELATYLPAKKSYVTHSLGSFAVEVGAPPPTPAPTPVVVASSANGDDATGTTSTNGNGVPMTSTMLVGIAGGSALVGALCLALILGLRRRSGNRPGTGSPGERARLAQARLESFWSERRKSADVELSSEVDRLRRELESVRFAPGRADHSETVRALERRLDQLIRRG